MSVDDTSQSPSERKSAIKQRHEQAANEVLPDHRSLYIGGNWAESASGETFETVDPTTGETLASVEAGNAEDIDRAVRAGFGFRVPVLGVFKKSDFTGLDVYEEVMSYLLKEIDRGTEPTASLRSLVEQGHYGVKTGHGVYDWEGADFDQLADERDQQLLAMLDAYEEAFAE